MMQYYDSVMVDLETTGTNPETAHIIQIAAVRFNVEEKKIDTSEMFDRCLLMSTPNRYWDEDTRRWWHGQKDGLLDSILERGEMPADVLDAFISFLARTPASKPLRLWAKPISFEWPLLQSYMRQYQKQMPVAYWQCVDLNSFIEGRGHERKEYWKGIEFQGDAHNALHDVLHQIEGAMRA